VALHPSLRPLHRRFGAAGAFAGASCFFIARLVALVHRIIEIINQLADICALLVPRSCSK